MYNMDPDASRYCFVRRQLELEHCFHYHLDTLQGVTRTGQSLQETIKQLTNIRYQQGHVEAESGVTLLRMEYITSHFIVQILISNKIIMTPSISNLTPMG